MNLSKLVIGTMTLALVAVSGLALGKENNEGATAKEKTFIMKAADGGMTEVELGKIAGEKGASQDVKDFGAKMVTDHSKANDQLKEVASKLGVTVPTKINAAHKATVDKMSSMSGEALDKAYVKEMVKDHKKDIAEFEMAGKEVKNEDLKKFIDDTVPVMKEHLSMIEKFDQVKK